MVLLSDDLLQAHLQIPAELYKTQDGVTWHPVTLDGLGDVGNYGFRTMVSADGRFYVGTANPYDGLEIWCGRSSD